MLVTSSQQLTNNASVNSVLIRGSNITISEGAGVAATLAVGDGNVGDLAGLLNVGYGNSITVDNLAFTLNEGVVFVNGDTLSVGSGIGGGVALSTTTFGAGITKAGPGTLALSSAKPTNASSYVGTTTITQGTLNISARINPLGSTNGIIVTNGSTLQMQGNITLSLPTVTMTYGGAGVNGQGGVQNVSGINTISVGTETMSTNTTINTTTGELVLNGVVGGGSALTKIGVGILEMTGAASNTFTGATFVNEGTLLLGKTGATATAIQGALTIGDGFGELVTPNNVQLVTGSTAGTFTLAFNGQTTTTLGPNATPAQVQTALSALTTIGSGNVVVGGVAGNYEVLFTGIFSGLNAAIPMLSVPGTTSYSAIQPSTQNDDVQLITVPSTTGSFALAFNGQTTGSLAFNATPAVVQAALQAIVGTNNVVVAGGPGSYDVVFVGTFGGLAQAVPTIQAVNSYSDDIQTVTTSGNGSYSSLVGHNNFGSFQTSLNGAQVAAILNSESFFINNNINVLGSGAAGSYDLVFGGSFAGQGQLVPTMTASGFAGVSASVSQANTPNPNVQFVNLTGTGGSFVLTFDGQTTASIPYNATPAQVQAALQNLVNIGPNNAVVDGTSNNYSIILTGTLASQAVNLPTTIISASGTALPVTSVGSGTTVMIGQAYPTSFTGADQVAFVAGLADTTEISANQTETLTSSGILNMQGQSDSFANLTMSGGQVMTGSGILTITSNITYNPGAPAYISGYLNLPGHTNITVNQGEHETLVARRTELRPDHLSPDLRRRLRQARHGCLVGQQSQ